LVQEGPFVPSLETRPFGTPLRRFRGLLKEYNSEKVSPDGGGREYMRITFDFIDLEVMESMEPYPFPIATLQISYSTATETRWDALAQSIKRVVGLNPTLEDIVGKTQEWAYLEATLRAQVEGVWTNTKQEAWQLVSLAGTVSGNGVDDGIDDHVLALLDGKTEQDFYAVLYADELVRKHPETISAATERLLLPALEKAGRITRDTEGIYHIQPKEGATPAEAALPPVTQPE